MTLETKRALEAIEKMAEGAGADDRAIQKNSEELYDTIVQEIAKRDGCNMSEAHARAAKHPLGQRAYTLAVEHQRRANEKASYVKQAGGRLIG